MEVVAKENFSRADLQNFFCTFFVGDSEFALPLENVQEVVSWPAKITPVPLSEPYLLGIFYLRETSVPVVDLNLLFGVETKANVSDRRIAITVFQEKCVGFVFDSTCEVGSFRSSVKTHFGEGVDVSRDSMVVAGSLKVATDRVLQILDLSALMKILRIPQISLSKVTKIKVDSGKEKIRCVVFDVLSRNFAFEVSSIHEIIDDRSLKMEESITEVFAGVVDLRGRKVPVLSMSKVFGFVASSKDNASQVGRIIILKKNQSLLGLWVNSVKEIKDFESTSLIMRPKDSSIRLDLFKGCLVDRLHGEISLVDFDEFFQNPHVVALSRIYDKLAEDQENEIQSSKSRVGSTEHYVVFKIKYMFGLASSNVKEVIDLPKSLIPLADSPKHLLGLYNLRGLLIPIVDLRKFLGLGLPEGDVGAGKVVVVSSQGEQMGLLVDDLEIILSLRESEKKSMPELILKDIKNDFQGMVSQGYLANTSLKDSFSFALLDLGGVRSKLKDSKC